jgi:hypothetical protein
MCTSGETYWNLLLLHTYGLSMTGGGWVSMNDNLLSIIGAQGPFSLVLFVYSASLSCAFCQWSLWNVQNPAHAVCDVDRHLVTPPEKTRGQNFKGKGWAYFFLLPNGTFQYDRWREIWRKSLWFRRQLRCQRIHGSTQFISPLRSRFRIRWKTRAHFSLRADIKWLPWRKYPGWFPRKRCRRKRSDAWIEPLKWSTNQKRRVHREL